MAHGERLDGHVKESCTTTPLSTLGVHVRRARSNFSNALNFRRSTIAALVLDDIAHSACRDSRYLGTTSIAPVEKTAGSHGFLPPIHCKSVPGVISSSPCL